MVNHDDGIASLANFVGSWLDPIPSEAGHTTKHMWGAPSLHKSELPTSDGAQKEPILAPEKRTQGAHSQVWEGSPKSSLETWGIDSSTWGIH